MNCVCSSYVCCSYLPREYPQAKERLKEIVGEHQFLDVKGWLALHVGGAGEPDHVVVEQTQTQGWPGGGHQEPVINPEMIC